MVRSQKNLEIIRDEKLVENAANVGKYLLERLQNLAAVKSGKVDNPRGKGLLCALDAKDTEHRDKIFLNCFNSGLLILKCGIKTLRLRPSLTFSKQDVDKFIEILEQSIASAA